MAGSLDLPVAHLSTGVVLPYADRGAADGRPVILLHAWGESSGSFDRLVPLLPPGVRALVPDQRGHGAASAPATGYSLASFADDVVAFMDALELPRAVLVGSSSGGYVAQQVAVMAPDRVAGLVLVGAPRSLLGRAPFADEVEHLRDPVDREWVARSLEWFPRCHPVPGWYIKDRVDDGAGIPAHVWREALAGLTEATPPTEIDAVLAPTLILWGERDTILTRASQEALAAAIPGALLTVYEGTGHLVLWEQPDRVAADVTAFVAGLEDRPGDGLSLDRPARPRPARRGPRPPRW